MLGQIRAMFRPRVPDALVKVLEQTGGGVHKRVDENRELVELLRREAPTVLQRCPEAEGWLRSNDEFFTALENLAAPLGAKWPYFAKGPGFPRPWPEKGVAAPRDGGAPVAPAPPRQEWVDHAYPLQKLTVQLQGTKHSHFNDIIGELETVLTRLRAGDVVGEMHDDDYGYRFTFEAASPGPSFFDEPFGAR